jgi:hypothetical protein
MSKIVEILIERSGEMWSRRRDRTKTPVLICLARDSGDSLFELSLEAGARHPFWAVKERGMTDAEIEEVREARSRARRSLSVLLYADEPKVSHYAIKAFVKDGRFPGWYPSVVRALLSITFEEMVVTSATPFKGATIRFRDDSNHGSHTALTFDDRL